MKGGKGKHKMSFVLGRKIWKFLYFLCAWFLAQFDSFRSIFCIRKHCNHDVNDCCLNHKVTIVVLQTTVQVLRYGTAN
jgi:hypothetical protein